MDLHPKDIHGSSIAVFIWDQAGECGGSMVLFGISRFVDGEFFVERDKKPDRIPIPESAWQNLRRNPDPEPGSTFETSPYIVMLRLGPMPDGVSTMGYETLDLPDFNAEGQS